MKFTKKKLLIILIISAILAVIEVGIIFFMASNRTKQESSSSSTSEVEPEVEQTETVCLEQGTDIDKVNLMEYINFDGDQPFWYYEIVESNVDTSKKGTYEMTVDFHDIDDNKTTKEILVEVS